MNRFYYPVVRMTPTDMEVVAEHLTYDEAVRDAALRDVDAGPIVWHQADDSAGCRDHARAL